MDGGRCRSLPSPALVLITDSRRSTGGDRAGTEWLTDAVHQAVLGGVNVVQLRERHLATDELVRLGRLIRDAAGGAALFFVNGDVDAALALGADGIHLPEDGADIADVRACVGSAMLISRAVHGVGAAIHAAQDGADFVQFGTVFESQSKPGSSPAGVDALRAVCNAVSIGVIAVGGITVASAPDVVEAGAAGVAIISALLDADDPRAEAAELTRALRLKTPHAAAVKPPRLR